MTPRPPLYVLMKNTKKGAGARLATISAIMTSASPTKLHRLLMASSMIKSTICRGKETTTTICEKSAANTERVDSFLTGDAGVPKNTLSSAFNTRSPTKNA